MSLLLRSAKWLISPAARAAPPRFFLVMLRLHLQSRHAPSVPVRPSSGPFPAIDVVARGVPPVGYRKPQQRRLQGPRICGTSSVAYGDSRTCAPGRQGDSVSRGSIRRTRVPAGIDRRGCASCAPVRLEESRRVGMPRESFGAPSAVDACRYSGAFDRPTNDNCRLDARGTGARVAVSNGGRPANAWP